MVSVTVVATVSVVVVVSVGPVMVVVGSARQAVEPATVDVVPSV